MIIAVITDGEKNHMNYALSVRLLALFSVLSLQICVGQCIILNKMPCIVDFDMVCFILLSTLLPNVSPQVRELKKTSTIRSDIAF